MKKIKFFAITFSVFMCALFSCAVSFAQADTIRYQGQVYTRLMPAPSGDYDMSEPSEPVLHPEMGLKESDIHIRAVRDFKKKYGKAVNETWLAGAKGYSVRFSEDAIPITVRYTNAGRWIHTTKRYKEAQLPKEIRAIVKPSYYDYSVVVVYEVRENGSSHPLYYIHLRENRNYKVIRVANGEMDELQSFQLQQH